MSPTALAALWYSTQRTNTTFVNAVTTELNSLALNMATDAGHGVQITSATVNGQSYSGQPILSNPERLAAIRIFLNAVTNNVPPGSRTYAAF